MNEQKRVENMAFAIVFTMVVIVVSVISYAVSQEKPKFTESQEKERCETYVMRYGFSRMELPIRCEKYCPKP